MRDSVCMPFSLKQAGEGGMASVFPRAGAFAFFGGLSPDAMALIGIIVLVMFVFRLFGREMRSSRDKTQSAEDILKEERDVLEKRVGERASALVEAEKKRLEELERNAEFGRLSQGLFHDLMSPLSSISLFLERLSEKSGDSAEVKETISKTVEASRRMSSFMSSVKKHIGGAPGAAGNDKLTANLKDELLIVRDILAYKARMAGVKMIIEKIPDISIQANPVRLHQLLVNLVSNGIESFDPDKGGVSKKAEKSVRASARKRGANVIVSIEDNGRGMDEEQLAKAGRESWSTKAGGTGIGLMTARSIAEKELGGSFSVKSAVGQGTTFIITIPM